MKTPPIPDEDSAESKSPYAKFGLVLIYGALLLALPLFIAKRALDHPEQPSFIAMMQGVPLPPGFDELRNRGTRFDSAEGSIIDATAVGRKNANTAHAFYENTLPQLGWNRADDSAYEKEGTRLNIETNTENARVFLHLTLTPITKP